jgi:hypothetical protein
MLGRPTKLIKSQYKNFFEAMSPVDKNKILADLASLMVDSEKDSE